MELPKYAIRTILLLLYIAAVFTRFVSADRSNYPYFNKTSATNYRYAYDISRTGSVLDLDKKAAWPEGISVSEARPLGVEYFTGYLYRLVKYFSETEERLFTRALTRVFFSLLVFTLFALSYLLWRCQVGALFAAFLVAFYFPIVEATNGSEFHHFHFAVVLISCHVYLTVLSKIRFSTTVAMLTALIPFMLLAVWEVAPYYLALFAILYCAWPGGDRKETRLFLALHAVVIFVSGLLLPHLSAQRFVFSLPASSVYVAVLYSVLAGKLPAGSRRSLAAILYIVPGAIILSVLLKPFYSGGLQPYPAIQYFLHRIQYFFAKPADPQVLPDAVRYIWTIDHAAPSGFAVFNSFFPFFFLLPPLILSVLTHRKEIQEGPGFSSEKQVESSNLSKWFLPSASAALLSVVLYLVDRSLLLLLALGVFPLFALSFRSIRKHLISRGPLLVLGAVLFLTQTGFPGGRLDISQWIARRIGLYQQGGEDFLRISVGNPDRNLIRFLLTRTSVRDPMLCLPGTSSLLTTFAGRTTLLVPGIESSGMIEKTISLLDKLYSREENLYQTCRENGIKYVLYSIDYVLDGSKYSPRYLAGSSRLDPFSAAYRMHFFPETLKHFTLVYENDVYRLFEVTDETRPIFFTDHPPVYQLEILESNNNDLDLFYDKVSNLLLIYGSANIEQQKGKNAAALELFDTCLRHAPHFTAARIGRAASLVNLGDLEKARDAYMTVIDYAPDNVEALYGIALVLGRLGHTEQAQGYIDILLSSTGDKKMIMQAKLLRKRLDERRSIDKSSGSE